VFGFVKPHGVRRDRRMLRVIRPEAGEELMRVLRPNSSAFFHRMPAYLETIQEESVPREKSSDFLRSIGTMKYSHANSFL
jgi:hypothetical protein